jgi:hypothetical protein
MTDLSQAGLRSELVQWLLGSDEPWTRYRTWRDLLARPEDDPDTEADRTEMLDHPQVQALMAAVAAWGDRPLKRHNDASHPLYAFSTLADFGLRADDAPSNGGIGMAAGIEAVLAHQSREGAFQTMLNIPSRFGGTGQDAWLWILCDAPTLLYALLAMGLGEDARVQRAVEHLANLVHESGWHCLGAPEVGRFRGPGRKDDPCPVANVYALKALAQIPALADSPAIHAGAEMLLRHWEGQAERKIYLFGIGTDFRRLKYPYVWYDILHVVEVLSQLPHVHADERFREMLEAITMQAGADGRYTASSMYRAWKGWSFADKRNPSPWLTFLVQRIHKRCGA